MSSPRRWPPALRFVVLVGVGSFFADFVYEGSRSVVGPYLATLGAGALAISVTAGLGEFLGYGLRLVSGPWADRTGRHWAIAIAGYVLQMTVVPLLALARTWPVAALLVVLERVGKATRNPPRDAMLSHAGDEIGQGWAFGLHEALDQAGATLGPLAVALVLLVDHHHYRVAFALLAIPAAVQLAFVAAARVTYPRPAELSSASARLAAPEGVPRTFWVYLGAAALIGAGFADFPLIAYRFERAGVVAPDMVPVFYAVAMAVGGVGSLLVGRLVDRRGFRVLLPLTVVGAAYAPLVFLGRFWAGLAGAVLWGLGTGVQESVIPALVGRMVAPDRRSSAFGLFTGVYGVAWFAGSVVIGLAAGVSFGLVVAFCLVSEAASLPLLVAAVRRASSASGRDAASA